MWKISYFLFIFGAAISLKNAYAITDEDKEAFRKHIMPIAMQCAKELGIEESDIEETKNNAVMYPCLVACIMEKTSVLKGGLIDKDAIEQETKEYIHDDDEIEKIVAIGQDCAMEANESDVSDGDKSCERASIFISCLKEKKAAAAMVL